MMTTNPAALPPCPERLTPEQIEDYRRDGYIAFVDALSPTEVERARATLSELVQRMVSDGEAQSRNEFWRVPDSRFLVQFEPGYAPDGAGDPQLELKVRKLFWFIQEHELFAHLAQSHPRIRGVLSSLIGADPILFQDMALVKPPFIGSEKPWHQDDAYFAALPLGAVCGVWIALDEATAENGCMHVIAGGHRDGPKVHIHDRDCEIATDRLDLSRVVPVPLPPGGAMFFHGLLPHQTPPNHSPDRRRALQFHYRSQDSRLVSREEYDGIFSENGAPASCAAAPQKA
jgi:hypothetical protein